MSFAPFSMPGIFRLLSHVFPIFFLTGSCICARIQVSVIVIALYSAARKEEHPQRVPGRSLLPVLAQYKKHKREKDHNQDHCI